MAVSTNSINSLNFTANSASAAQQPVAVTVSDFSEALRSSAIITSGNIELEPIFEAAGQRYNIPVNLLKSVAKVESGFRPNATSSAGAMGIMQLMPGTARGLGVSDAYDPEQNIMGGAKYLRQMLDRFGGDVSLALGAYNAGPGAVVKYDGVPSFSQNYVSKVLNLYYGGDIPVGAVAYGGHGSGNQDGSSSGVFPGLSAFGESLSQMILIKLIESQMNSSHENNGDKKSVF